MIMSLQEMYDEACAFADCADMCKNAENSHYMGYGTPYIVNSAFACEVFLKTMLQKHKTKWPNSHKIKQLYELLPEHTKAKIKDITLQRSWDWQDCFGIEHLERISDAFNDWRYSYEHKRASLSCPTYFLDAFRDALREQCAFEIFGTTWEQYDKWKRSVIPQ